MKVEEIFCDVCGKKIEKPKAEKARIQFIFTTETTEGRGVEPYLSSGEVDICEGCIERRVSGESLFASGAQGHNTYYFQEDENLST